MAECLYVFYKPSVMKDLKHVIGLASLFVVVYHSAPFIGIPAEVIALMFVLSPFVVLWMVYSILKHGKPSGHTFDERFYDDWNYERNGKEEKDA